MCSKQKRQKADVVRIVCKDPDQHGRLNQSLSNVCCKGKSATQDSRVELFNSSKELTSKKVQVCKLLKSAF